MTDTHSAPSAQDPTVALAKSALQFGAVTGGLGYLVGGTAGIIKGSPSFLFATASGIQTFALGTTFAATRSGILHAWNTGEPTRSDLTKASTAAGGISGAAIALVTRGRANVIPAALVWSAVGGLGQLAINSSVVPHNEPDKSFMRRLAEKKWSPISFISDEDYAKILQERMLKIDVEIAIVDDKLVALKEQQRQEKLQETSTATNVSIAKK